MKARDAMIAWEPATAETPEAPGRMKAAWQPSRAPEVQVFHNDDQVAHRRHGHLSSSLGACLAIWCVNDPLIEVFRTFLHVAGDGVPLADIHREFLKIDEYAAMTNGTPFFGVEIPDPEED